MVVFVTNKNNRLYCATSTTTKDGFVEKTIQSGAFEHQYLFEEP